MKQFICLIGGIVIWGIIHFYGLFRQISDISAHKVQSYGVLQRLVNIGVMMDGGIGGQTLILKIGIVLLQINRA